MSDIKKSAINQERGPKGPRGPTGHTGARGPTGPTGPEPTGDPGTQAYFGPLGLLTDDVNATMSTADWQIKTVPGGANVAHLRRDIGSVAFGALSSATGVDALAEGNNSVALGVASHAEGIGTNAVADASHSEGASTEATAFAAHSEGNGTSANGAGSHAEGTSTTANGASSHAEGATTLAAGGASHAEGNTSRANGSHSHAEGLLADALRDGQFAHSSGPGALIGPNHQGDSQYSFVTMAGQTPGLAPGESVNLLLGTAPGVPFVLAVDKAYTIVVTAVMEGQIAGASRMQSFRRLFAIRPQAGVPTLIASGVAEQIGDAAAATWTITVTAGATLGIAFSTGATTSAAQATATVEFTEIRST
jgi:hypothetical protein